MKLHLLFIVLFALAISACQTNKNEPVKIIFDTDMGPDYDDVGAIATLHSLAAKGECEILACCASDGYPTVAPTIEAFNRFYNKPEIPIGAAVEGAPDFSCPNHWNDSIVAKYLPQPKTNADYPDAIEVYRTVLASQADKSVTIVTVGFVSNLAALMKSEPDAISPLNGMEMIIQKVKNWVAMAGKLPEGGEFNVNKDVKSSEYVFANWPTPILFSGFEIGNSIMTGRRLADEGSANNPLSWAYRYNLATYENRVSEKRKSWDLTAVLCAVRDPEKYFYVNGPGKFYLKHGGYNMWDADVNANHYFLVHKYPYQQIADVLDELMMYEPGK